MKRRISTLQLNLSCTVLFVLSCLISSAQTITVKLDQNALSELEARPKKGSTPIDSIYDIQTKGTDPHIFSTI